MDRSDFGILKASDSSNGFRHGFSAEGLPSLQVGSEERRAAGDPWTGTLPEYVAGTPVVFMNGDVGIYKHLQIIVISYYIIMLDISCICLLENLILLKDHDHCNGEELQKQSRMLG